MGIRKTLVSLVFVGGASLAGCGEQDDIKIDRLHEKEAVADSFSINQEKHDKEIVVDIQNVEHKEQVLDIPILQSGPTQLRKHLITKIEGIWADTKIEGKTEGDSLYDYDIKAKITDVSRNEHIFHYCFSVSSGITRKVLPVQSIQYNMVLTLREKNNSASKHGIQRFFWLTELNKINRDLETNITTFYLKDGNAFLGEWVSNTDWETLYSKERNILEKGYIYGLSQSEERYKKINIGSVASIEFDNSKAKEIFDRRHREYFKKNSPKEIVLNDNSKIISDISYMIDFCGHYYSTDGHIRLRDDLELLKVIPNLEAQAIEKGEKGKITYYGDGYFKFTEDTGGIGGFQRLIPVEAAYNYKSREIKEYLHQIQIPLDELLDIEFTGEYYKLIKREDNDNFYCSTADNDYREIIVNNRSGTKERAFLYSTSESHFGHCGESLMNRTHDMDSVIVMQEYGAIAIPLNLVKKIIFLDNKKRD